MTRLQIAEKFSYRYAGAVIKDDAFSSSYDEIVSVIRNTEVPLLNPQKFTRGAKKMKRRQRGNAPAFFLPVDQKALNSEIDRRFVDLRWMAQNRIVDPVKHPNFKTGLKGDFKKGRLHIEAQFGNMARWYTDVFKFQLAYALDEIDLAVLIVPVQRFANLIDENVADFERVKRELPAAKMSFTLPIMVLGVAPDDLTPIKECYELAAQNYARQNADSGHIATVPFEARSRQKDSDLFDD